MSETLLPTTSLPTTSEYRQPALPAWGRRIGFGEPQFCRVMDFLTDEATLLDESRLEEWLTLLADDLRYTMPVRRTTGRGGESVDPQMLHFDDDLMSIKLRVWRVTRSEFAYAENPASRNRRYISNVQVHETDTADELAVRSYELVTRSRWDLPTYDFLSLQRDDVLRVDDSAEGLGFKLVRRTILTDEVVVGSSNISIML
jgi:3-phenylpropionate/cinnamic acid dioxygenase small subunit